MSYIDKNLSTHEQVLHRAFTSNAFVLAAPAITLVFGVVAGLLIGAGSGSIGAGAAIGGLMCFLFGSVPMLISGYITKATTEVALTNQRVILKWGLVRRNTIETYLDKVEGIAVDQSILGRLLNYGSVAVRGTGGGTTPCPGIASPQEFRRAVNEHIQNTRLALSGASSVPPPSLHQVVSPGQAANVSNATQPQPVSSSALHVTPAQHTGVSSTTPTPTTATTPQYWFSAGGVDSGPHSLDDMRRLRQTGKLTDDILVYREGEQSWQGARMFPEILA